MTTSVSHLETVSDTGLLGDTKARVSFLAKDVRRFAVHTPLESPGVYARCDSVPHSSRRSQEMRITHPSASTTPLDTETRRPTMQRRGPMRLAAVVGVAAWFLGASDVTGAGSPAGPEMVPDQIIVKLEPEIARHAPRALRESFGQLSGDPDAAALDRILERHRVTRIRRVFRSFEDSSGRLRETAKARAERIRSSRARAGGRVPAPKDVPALEDIFVLDLESSADLAEAIAELSADDRVEYAHPNFIYHLQGEPLPPQPYIPNDRYVAQGGMWSQSAFGQSFPDLYGLRNTQALEAFQEFETDRSGEFDPGEMRAGEGVVVAVIDSGIDTTHVDLVDNLWVNAGEDLDGNSEIDESDFNGIDDDDNGFIDDITGYDFVEDTGRMHDPRGHGTYVAGIIAAVTDNEAGIAGMAPGAKLMSVRALGAAGGGTTAQLAGAILYAADQHADITSNSWGGLGHDPTIKASFDYAEMLEILSIAAAGNSTRDVSSFQPAGFPNVMAVAAVDHDDVRATFTNFGNLVDLAAPGVQILSLNAHGGDNSIAHGFPERVVDADYIWLNGTSASCPYVSGAAAAVMSAFAAAEPSEIWARLRVGADSIDALNPGSEGLLGTGRLNLSQALVVAPRPDIQVIHIHPEGFAPGTQGSVVVRLRNFWEGTQVAGTLGSNDPNVTISAATTDFGSFANGEIVDNSAAPFLVDVSDTASLGTVVDFTLLLSESGGTTISKDFAVPITIFADVSTPAEVETQAELVFDSFMQDYDGDGITDLHFDDWATNQYYRGQPDGTFAFANGEIGVGRRRAITTLLLDIDNDGDKDLFIGGGAGIPDGQKLLLNNGDGTHTDITAGSGLDVHGFAHAVAFDYDDDEFIDIAGASASQGFDFGPPPVVDFPYFVLRNNGDHTFADVTASTGIPRGLFNSTFKGATVAFDADHDGRDDLLLVPGDLPFSLWMNQGDGSFVDATATAFDGTQLIQGRGATVGDYDSDGIEDIFLTGVDDAGIERNALFRGLGGGVFTEVTATAGDLGATAGVVGASRGNEFFDFDNDGDLDLLVSGGVGSAVDAQIFENLGDGSFDEITAKAFGPVASGEAAVSVGDLDRDGFLDVYAPDGKLYSEPRGGGLMLNGLDNGNAWLKMDLEGTVSPRDAYGARVSVTADSVTATRVLRTGSQDNEFVHFGLGDAEAADEATIHWPSGLYQRLAGLAANQTLIVTEPSVQCPSGYDDEGDGVCNVADNCSSLQNRDQRDTNVDGYGNLCDADYNDDGIAGILDIAIFRSAIGTTDGDPAYNPDCDHDGDGVVDADDFAIFGSLYGKPPGPSGLACAGTIPCPVP